MGCGQGGPIIELVVPIRSLYADRGDQIRVSGDLARYLCANGLAILIRDPMRVVSKAIGPS